MRARVLSRFDFAFPAPGWDEPPAGPAVMRRPRAVDLDPGRGGAVTLSGPGVHTRNGDAIELTFVPRRRQGRLRFGFAGGMESAAVVLDLAEGRAELHTSEWDRPQPVATARCRVTSRRSHTLRLRKTENGGALVRRARIRGTLDGVDLMEARDLNVLPEMGVSVTVSDGPMTLQRFVHRGRPCAIPEYLHVGGWQLPNRPDLDANLAGLERGLTIAAERGVQLIVTPETSLTGLFPNERVTRDPAPIAAAEARLRRFQSRLHEAPYLVVGLPVWERGPAGHRTRLNASRVYAPDGTILATCAKIHSCEPDFWHGYRLHEFDVHGVPCCMHVCHDGRYPETWTLPVMFGARLVLHPANGGAVSGSVDAFEGVARTSTGTSHAFYVRVNGGGGSYVAGPQKFDNILAVSPECRRDNRAFPMVGTPTEGLVAARIRVHDAFGYWPVRSYRASEEVAAAQLALYQALGGQRGPQAPA